MELSDGVSINVEFSQLSAATKTPKLFDQSRWDFPHYILLDSDIPKMAYDKEFFGGVCWRNNIQTWSKCYVISELGYIEQRFEELNQVDTFILNSDSEEIDNSFEITAGELSKSAGKIFLHLPDQEGQKGKTITVASGFWIERDKFITRSHFYSSHCDTDEARQEAGEELKKEKPSRPFSYVTCNTAAEMYNKKSAWKVKLLAADNEADIAIFQAIKDANDPPP